MEDFELLPKSVAIAELGGTVTEAARRMGTSVAAISKWPDPLSRRITERVYGVLARRRILAPGAETPASAQLGAIPHAGGGI